MALSEIEKRQHRRIVEMNYHQTEKFKKRNREYAAMRRQTNPVFRDYWKQRLKEYEFRPEVKMRRKKI
jgi:hypothetical protein